MKLDRRRFLSRCKAACLLTGLQGWNPAVGQAIPRGAPAGTDSGLLNCRQLASCFPALKQHVNGQRLIYLDSAATAQRPTAVTDAIRDFYNHDNANPGQSLHALARTAFEAYEGARRAIADFINARDPLEIVWTRGTTEAINLVASTWGSANLRPGDEVLLTIAEHASCMLPWQIAAEKAGARVRYVDVTDEGDLKLEELDQLLTARTKILCVTHVSNVLGTLNPIKEICSYAHARGAKVLLDAAQSVPHLRVDVQELDCDFLAFSGHKMMGPMGIGVLWVRRELLEEMPPYQYGSNMAHGVDVVDRKYSPGAMRFGAGSPNVADAVGLAAAVRFLSRIGREQMWAHEQALTRHMLERLIDIKGIRLIGPTNPTNRISLFAFSSQKISTAELVRLLDANGIAIRGGDLAALPLLKRFGVATAARASLYVYTTMDEVDQFCSTLQDATG